jgi:hypothetical protein
MSTPIKTERYFAEFPHHIHEDADGDLVDYIAYESLLEQDKLLVQAWNDMRKERDVAAAAASAAITDALATNKALLIKISELTKTFSEVFNGPTD